MVLHGRHAAEVLRGEHSGFAVGPESDLALVAEECLMEAGVVVWRGLVEIPVTRADV